MKYYRGFLRPYTFPTFPKDSSVDSVDSVDEYLSTKKEGVKRVRTYLQDAQNRMTTMANRKGSDRSFEVKNYVYLKLQPYRQQSVIHKSS
jgi:hypothetical protein